MERYGETTLALPSGGRGRKFESSHPDQIFFIELGSCCLFGTYHELTISPLPEFCRTPLTGKFLASTIIKPCCACALGRLAHEHCLGSAVWFQRRIALRSKNTGSTHIPVSRICSFQRLDKHINIIFVIVWSNRYTNSSTS